jgi:hypothetical protein
MQQSVRYICLILMMHIEHYNLNIEKGGTVPGRTTVALFLKHLSLSAENNSLCGIMCRTHISNLIFLSKKNLPNFYFLLVPLTNNVVLMFSYGFMDIQERHPLRHACSITLVLKYWQ